jgi:hypothetical protein
VSCCEAKNLEKLLSGFDSLAPARLTPSGLPTAVLPAHPHSQGSRPVQ